MSIPRSALAILCIAPLAHAQLTVSSIAPPLNKTNVSRSTTVAVTFDRPINRATVTPRTFHLFGKITGPLAGTYAYSNGDRTITFTPARRLAAGEYALVTLSHDLRAADGSPLRAAGYTASFTTRAAPSSASFEQIASMSNRDATGAQTRIYGTNACDLDRDGFADLCTINEVSSDLRVFLNRADGSGLCEPMLTPYIPMPEESSPNDVADFDGDGFIDVITSSAFEARVAIAFGNGDGSFRSVTEIPVGSYPRGFGIFDADGDGDFDISVACAGASNINYIRNNGNGTFAAPVPFEGGVNGEYGMNGADMNNDGIFDLVVAGQTSQTIAVLRGNGNGTFTNVSTRPVGGQNWVVLCGDLDNDGNMDVSTANSFSASGSILMGNGNGTLQAARIMPTDGHTVATDLADLDGDGDLDWVLSSFGAGRWYTYLNDGHGFFTHRDIFIAPANPSCTAPVDLDNDGDMDLVFTDEIADVVILMRNTGSPASCPADFNDDGFLDFFDYDEFVVAFESGNPRADFNADGFLDFFDYDEFVTAFEIGC